MEERQSAFEALFRAHHAAVYRYVVRRVEQTAVQDVVADTFLVAWRRHDEIVGDPLPWLLGVARRVSANHLRARARRAALDERLTAHSALPPASGIATQDGALRRALTSLGEADCEALLLVAWDELSNHDAAKVVGCSTTAFAVRLHRARRRLRQALESQSEDSPANSGVEGIATSDVH